METVDLVQLKEWAEAVCRVPSSDPADVLGALRLPTTPTGPGRLRPDRPPTGVTCEIGLVGTAFRSLTVRFAVPAIARAALDDALGHGLLLRRLGHAPRRRIAYRVVIPEAPFSVDAVAGFVGPPLPDSLTTDVMLRRHRGVTRAREDVVDEEGWAAPQAAVGTVRPTAPRPAPN